MHLTPTGLQFSCKFVNLSLQTGNLTIRFCLLLLLLITQGNIGIQKRLDSLNQFLYLI